MKVFVLMTWSGRCAGVVSTEELARAKGYTEYEEEGPGGEGYFDEHEVDE